MRLCTDDNIALNLLDMTFAIINFFKNNNILMRKDIKIKRVSELRRRHGNSKRTLQKRLLVSLSNNACRFVY